MGLFDAPSEDSHNNLKLLYKNLGFYHRDIKDLKGNNYKKQTLAIIRLIKTSSSIPHGLLKKLVHHSNFYIRFKAMGCLIETEEDKALMPLMEFISDQKNDKHKGHVISLLEKYSAVDSEGIVFMLSHAENEYLIHLLLLVLQVHPNPKSEEVIYEIVNMDSNKEIIIAAIKILLLQSSEKLGMFLELLSEHSSWQVRVIIAKALKEVKTDSSFKILEKYTLDSSPTVRERAVDSLIALNTHLSNKYISEVFKDKKHKSHKLLKNQLILSEFRGV